MTGACAEALGRKWLAYDLNEEYLAGSLGRFQTVDGLQDDPTEPQDRPGRAPACWTRSREAEERGRRSSSPRAGNDGHPGTTANDP